MATITEDYVSFETAKLLKEKGFKGQRENFYENNKIISYINYWDRITPKQRYEAIEAPTLQMAMKWLREVHDIKIMIRPYVDGTYSYEIINGFWYVNFDSYEDAAEAAIKYCLENLI